jgi:hypothetical protein
MFFIEIVAFQVSLSEIYVHLRFPFTENFQAWLGHLRNDYAFQPGDLKDYFWLSISRPFNHTDLPKDENDEDIIPF